MTSIICSILKVSKMHNFPSNIERDDYVDLIGYQLRRDAVPITFGDPLTTTSKVGVDKASDMEPSSPDLPPFKKIKLGYSSTVADKASCSTQLDEPEIKIELITLQSEQDPLQNTSPSTQIVSTKPPESPLLLKAALQGIPVTTVTPKKSIILRKVAPPKGVILRKIKSIAANQAEVIKHLNIAPKVALLQKGQPSSSGVPKPVSDTVDLTLSLDESEANDNQTQEIGEISSRSSLNVSAATELTGGNRDSDLFLQGFKCKVEGCTGKTKYYFPAPFTLRALNIWRYCIGDETLQSGNLLCGKHFLDVDMLEPPVKGNIVKLKDHVVPSLAPIQTGCIIPGCQNRDVNAPNMYPIPVWGNYLPWVRGYFSRYKHKNDLHRYRVCERHFADVNSKNVFDLVPTLNLPGKVYARGQTTSKSANVCAHLDCNADGPLVKFPKNYSRAVDFLTLCNRNDILSKSHKEIQQFLANSKGLCLDHFKEIEAQESNDGEAINNAIEKPQESLVCVVSEHSTTNKESRKKVEEPSENEEIYVPIRDYCAFINCSTYAKRLGVTKYRFPVNSNLLKQWKRAAGIPDIINDADLKVLFVCEKHFSKDQYTSWHTLQMASVPLPHDGYVDPKATDANSHWLRKKRITWKKYQINQTKIDEPKVDDIANSASSTSNVPEWLTNYEPIRSNTCCVKHCRASENSTILFDFPTSAMGHAWIKAVENRANIPVTASRLYNGKKICCAHFEERFRVGDDGLRADAIPTLNLVKETEIKSEKLDTDIVWTRCESDLCDQDPQHILGHIKGKAILRKNSIEFPNIKRELRFGKDCRKRGINKFPYKMYRLPVKEPKSAFEYVGEGHKLQVHTAIIIDDDDESERAAIDMICEIIKRNEGSTKKNRKETKAN